MAKVTRDRLMNKLASATRATAGSTTSATPPAPLCRACASTASRPFTAPPIAPVKPSCSSPPRFDDLISQLDDATVLAAEQQLDPASPWHELGFAQLLGRTGERLAEEYLVALGADLLARNYQSRHAAKST